MTTENPNFPTDAQVSESKYRAIAFNLATELTGITGQSWIPVLKYDTGFYLRRADGLAIFLHSSFGGEDKWSCSMAYNECVPNVQDYYPSMHASDKTGRTSVNITKSKTPKQIAGELVRRLITVIEPAWAEALNLFNQGNEFTTTTHKNLAAIAAVLGVSADVPTPDPKHPRSYDPKITSISGSRHNLNTSYMDLSTHGDNTATLNLRNVPMDVALKIAELLKR